MQNILRERAPARLHPRRTASRYLLSGIARCGNCGKALIGVEAKSGRFSYYVCGTLIKKGAKSCPAHYLNRDKFEGLVIDKIKEQILTKENLIRLVELVNEELDSASNSYKDELDGISSELSTISNRLERLYDAVETGEIALRDLTPRIHDLRDSQQKLHTRRAEIECMLSDRRIELASLGQVTSYVNDLHNLLNNSALSERRAFIRNFVKEVKVTGNEVELTYTLPISSERIPAQEHGVLSIGHSGGQ